MIHTRVSLEIFAKNESVTIPDAEKLLAEKKREPGSAPNRRSVREQREEYAVQMMRSEHAAVSLEEGYDAGGNPPSL